MTFLFPLQRLTPVPYAVHAQVVEWGGIMNIPPNIADGVNEVPTGVIVMWSGSLASIPDGWTLCDGTSGTPDLRDRFIMGTAALQDPGAFGGTSAHGHSVDAHNHLVQPPTGSTNSAGGHSHSTGSPSSTADVDGNGLPHQDVASWSHTHTVNSVANHSHNVTIGDFFTAEEIGATNTSEHLPPYFKLAFIMKLP